VVGSLFGYIWPRKTQSQVKLELLDKLDLMVEVRLCQPLWLTVLVLGT